MSKHVNTAKNEPLENVSPTENEGFPGKLASDGIVVKPGIGLGTRNSTGATFQ